jgi:hypothetical protein
MTNEEQLVFTALCDRYRSTTHVSRTMSRLELQQATGLSPETIEQTLSALSGPIGSPGARIAFERDRVVLGPVWRERCRALPGDPAPRRP